jgi:hypothetical protein
MSRLSELPQHLRVRQRRAAKIPNWQAHGLQGLGLAASRVASEALPVLGLAAPSSCCSHKTNFGAAQNWPRPGDPSERRALPHVDSVNCRNNLCTRSRRIGEDEATNLQTSGSLHNRFLWVSSQD